MKNKEIRRRWKTCIGILLLLAAWQLASMSGIWSAYVLPSPSKTGRAFWVMFSNGTLFRHIWVSFQRVLQGFSIAFALAFLGGMIVYGLPSLEEFYGDFLEFMRNVPPISLIALLILWFGIGETSRIIIIVLASFFPMYLNIKKGFTTTDPQLLEVGAVYGLSRREIFFRIVLPAAIPDVLVGMRVGLGYSWRAIIGAEMIAASRGLGYLILDAQQMSRSDKVIAGIITIGLVGMFSDWLFRILISKIVRNEMIRDREQNG